MYFLDSCYVAVCRRRPMNVSRSVATSVPRNDLPYSNHIKMLMRFVVHPLPFSVFRFPFSVFRFPFSVFHGSAK